MLADVPLLSAVGILDGLGMAATVAALTGLSFVRLARLTLTTPAEVASR